MPAEMKFLTSRTLTTAGQNLFEQAWTLLPNPQGQLSGTLAAPDLAAWRVDPLRNLIQTCDSASPVVKRQLEPRLMHLLCLLAAADGNVVTREQLMEALWPKVIVNENSLTRAVSELRKALATPDRLQPSTTRCTLIETLSKKGYRLNASVHTSLETSPVVVADASMNAVFAHPTLHWLPPFPRLNIGKALMITALLLMLPWSLGLMKTPPSSAPAGLAGLSAGIRENLSTTPLLEDRVLTETSALPTGVQWLESLHLQIADNDSPASAWINDASDRTTRHSLLSPGGDLLAVVEEFAGQSQLKLRSLNNPDESWTAFTAPSPITHLQWSPLEDGILFTIVEHTQVSAAVLSDQAGAYAVGRLMLLDLQTMQVRELYRREQTAPDDSTHHAGSLT